MRKIFIAGLMIALVVGAIGLVGCSGKQPAPAGEGQGGGPSTGPKRKLVAVGECTFAPFEYIDEKTGQPAGFDVDLIKAIAEASGFEVEYRHLDWNSLIAALLTKEADLVVSGMTITDERALQVKFSDPYFESGQAWAVKEGSTLRKLEDLSGKKVAVQVNTTGDFSAQKLNEKFAEEERPQMALKRLEAAADLFNELKTGAVDAIICDLPVIQEYLKNHPQDKIVIPEPAFTVEYYGIAMRKEDKDVHELINKGLAKIKASGKYDEIYQKYFGTR